MIAKILEKVEAQTITIGAWITCFAGVLFVRFILEALSSPTSTGNIPSNSISLVHFGLYWITLILGIIIIVGFFTKNYLRASKLALFGLPIIWLAPIFDIIISKGHGFTESYILDNGHRLLTDLLTFFGPNFVWGATYGIRIEMLIVLIGVAWYLKRIKLSFSKVVMGVLAVYIFGFIMASLPGIFYTVSHPLAPVGVLPDIYNPQSVLPDIYKFYDFTITRSTISHNTLYEGVGSVSHSRFYELGFDKLFTQILFILSTFLVALFFWKIDRKKFKIIIKNIRLERIGSYLALLVSGMGFAYINGLSNPIVFADVLGVICLFISWISLWMFAVHQNDIADVEIDKISNKNRPLVKKDVDEKDMRETSYIWLALALIGAWSAGFYPFFMSLVYLFAAHIYSSPPLRLRQFPIISSFIIAIASLATVLAGFYFISVSKNIQTFPMLLSVGILVMVTLAINVKDMKDVEGDKANSIMTLPTLFPENGGKLVGLCFAMSFLLVPIFLSFYFLYIFAIPAAIIGYRLVIKKPYSEKPIFILRFAFLLGVALMYSAVFWLAHIFLLG